MKNSCFMLPFSPSTLDGCKLDHGLANILGLVFRKHCSKPFYDTYRFHRILTIWTGCQGFHQHENLFGLQRGAMKTYHGTE